MANIVATRTGQGPKDVCTKGYSCGVACISKKKECLKNLSPESVAIAQALAQMLRQTGRLGASGETKERHRDKGLTQYINSLKRAEKNIEKAKNFRDKKCAGGRTQECIDAEEAYKNSITDRNDLIRHGKVLAKQLGMMAEKQKKYMWNQEQIDDAVDHRDAHDDLQRRIQARILLYEDEQRRIENDPNILNEKAALDKAFRQFQEGLNQAYDDHFDAFPDTPRKNPNGFYTPDDVVEAVYNMLPGQIRSKFNKAGTIGQQNQALTGLRKEQNPNDANADFDSEGYYTGATSNVIGQRREADWNGADRGKVVTELYLRNVGRSMISDGTTYWKDAQLEHFNDYSNHGRSAETYGNLGPAGSKENQSKNNKTMGDYIDNNLNPEGVRRDAATENAKQTASSSRKSQNATNAQNWVSAPDDGVSRHKAVQNVLNNDNDAKKRFIASVRNNTSDPDLARFANSSDGEILEAYGNLASQSDFSSGTGGKLSFIAAHSSIGDGKTARETYRVVEGEAKGTDGRKVPDTYVNDYISGPRDAANPEGTYSGQVDGMAAYTQDAAATITGARRGDRNIKVNEARMVAAAYAVGTDANRAEIRGMNREVFAEIVTPNEIVDRQHTMATGLYAEPVRDRMNGNDPSGRGYEMDFSWYNRK